MLLSRSRPAKPRVAAPCRVAIRTRRPGLILATLAGLSLACSSARAEDPSAGSPSFRHEVMALFSKAGCNSGPCHGNQNGKGGFRLSLRGQEPERDYAVLTREFAGRRLDRLDPKASLLLRKPTGQLAHEGGTRFAVQSDAYRILHDWIESGTPLDDPPAVQKLEVQSSPDEHVILAETQASPETGPMQWPEVQLQVFAHFADGSRRDVTHLTVFECSNLLAEVTAEGRVRGLQPGESTVVVRYLNQQVALPYAFVPSDPSFQYRERNPYNVVDQHVDAKLQSLRLNASEVCDDATFVRRAYLDAIGSLPTAQEARRFVQDTHPDKRTRLVDALLARPEFAEFWALKWADILRAEEKVLDSRGVEVYHAWIRDWIAADRPFDQFVTELLTAQGSTYENAAANFYRANRDPSTRAETVARLFLGYRLQCARCHNHPFDRWTQDDYYDWTTLFSQIEYKIVKNERTDKLDKNEFVGEQIVLWQGGDEVLNPRSGQPATPRFLRERVRERVEQERVEQERGEEERGEEERGEQEMGEQEREGADGRLEAMAAWLTDPSNAQFARVQANWIWYHLMGRGLVEPIDDFRQTNPASHPELLEALRLEFQRSGFRLRPLVRTIMLSRAYQASSEPNTTNAHDQSNYSRALVKRLPAEVLLDCQTQLLGVPASFAGYEAGMRAAALPGVAKGGRRVPREEGDRFLATFGKPQRLLACECERSNETTLAQAMMLIGDDSLHQRLRDPKNRLAQLAASQQEPGQIIDELYWSALTRAPTDEERSLAIEWLTQSEDRFEALQDLAWALMNAKEFVFRH